MKNKLKELSQEQLNALTPKQRVRLASWLFREQRIILTRQVQAEHGQLSPERLKWEVALKMYGDEPNARKFVEQKLAEIIEQEAAEAE